MSSPLDDDARYLAVRSRDARFDGWFFVAITSTGIYCRPSCPSPPARPARMRFFPTAAAAQRAGFRACKRCVPDATPGSPEWDRRADVVGRAMRLIADGVVDRDGVPGLARRLGYSDRHLNRLLIAEVGAGPLALARAQRAQTARILLETTELRAAEIAFAAGFSSVRQFNETTREVFALAPMELRARSAARRSPHAAHRDDDMGRARNRSRSNSPTGHHFRLPRSSDSSPHGPCPVSRRATGNATAGRCLCRTGPASPRSALSRVPRATCDASSASTTSATSPPRSVGCDGCSISTLTRSPSPRPSAVDEVLGRSVASLPGLRTPGHVDGDELAFRAVLGQQVSVAGARTIAGRLAAEHGRRLGGSGSLRTLFPGAEVLAALEPDQLPMPASRAEAMLRLASVLASGDVTLDAGADRDVVAARLLAIPGIGPWTVAYIRMRALGDPDAFLPSDLGVRRALEARGLPGDPRSAASMAESWRPWRSYALQYLWSGPMTRGLETTDRRQAARKEQAA